MTAGRPPKKEGRSHTHRVEFRLPEEDWCYLDRLSGKRGANLFSQKIVMAFIERIRNDEIAKKEGEK